MVVETDRPHRRVLADRCRIGREPAPNIFAFPGVRDWLSFTAEAAFANTTSLIVGFAASQARGPGSICLNRSCPPVNSTVISTRRRFLTSPAQGQVDLGETVRPLFDSGQIFRGCSTC